MDTHAVTQRVDNEINRYVEDLKSFVAIPSVSASSFDQSTLKESARWIADRTERLGLKTQIVELKTESGLVGRPAILASRPAEEGKPTVLLYAHHDVQPPGDAADWETDPFTAVEKSGRLYGRGAADDKAGVLVHLAAIENAEPGVGIRLFIEGEEEVGSPTFTDFLHAYKDELKLRK